MTTSRASRPLWVLVVLAALLAAAASAADEIPTAAAPENATENAFSSNNDDDDGAAATTTQLYQPSSCTHVITDGELVTENQWVDCSFGVQSLNLTADGEENLFVVMAPGGAFSLCTRQPFGKVFDDDSLQMWIYVPDETILDSVQLEILYSQQADTFAYQTGVLDNDDIFTRYTPADLAELQTSSVDALSSLDSHLKEGNWSSVKKNLDAQAEEEEKDGGGKIQTFPIYNRVTLRNTNRDRAAAIILDSLVLVNNYTSQRLFVTSTRDSECELPHARLPSAMEVDETFRSMIEVSEIQDDMKTQVPLYAGIACALVVAAISVAVLTIVLHKRKLKHLYIPFEDLEFDAPPEIIGRGKFGYVLRASYNSFPVATKLVLPSSTTGKGTMFETSANSLSSHSESRGTVTYFEGNKEKAKMETGAQSMEMFMYGKQTNMTQSFASSKDHTSFAVYSIDGTGSSQDSTSSAGSLARDSSFNGLVSRKKNWKLKKDFEDEIRLLMKLRHPNIVTIMGVSKDKEASDYVLVMERMTRGSLIDCLLNPSSHMDPETILGIIRDIAAGMAYLHNLKPTVVHNDLRAANILVDDNFAAKISDFGLSGRQKFISSSSRWPWTAPEIFGGSAHTTKTDVYSFGVLLIEIYTRCKLTVSDMKLVVPKEAPVFAISLIRQCLHPNPSKRPTFAQIQEQIQAESLKLRRSPTIVPARNVMCAHLPATMAEDIKMGRAPSSTTYKCVTLLMSDIVGYTALTEKLGPQRIAEVLNQFYRKLDALVTKYNLYKMETIGDAYFVVGGIQDQGNDKDHCARILEFSEEAIRVARETSISFDQNNGADQGARSNISIRIGVHSGPCVGAVVGSLNPKFSLYGDTVNVVSRIETTGKPDCIHVSSDAADLLRRQRREMSAHLEYRGSTKLKGKGYMSTYFFNTGQVNFLNANAINKYG